MPTLNRTAITNKESVNMFNLKTIGKFNGSKFDELTSHPAIEEPCYMKFRKIVYRNILSMKIAETTL